LALRACFLGLHRLVFGSSQPWSTLGRHVLGAHGFVAEDHFFAINDSFWFHLAPRRGLRGVSRGTDATGTTSRLWPAWAVGSALIACVAYGEWRAPGWISSTMAIRIPSFFAGLALGQIVSGRGWVLRLNGWLATGLGCIGYLVMFRGVFLGYLVTALALIALTAVVHRELRGVRWRAPWPALLAGVGALSDEIYLLHQPLMRDYAREALEHWAGIRIPTSWPAGGGDRGHGRGRVGPAPGCSTACSSGHRTAWLHWGRGIRS
jgi:hypothetical protein